MQAILLPDSRGGARLLPAVDLRRHGIPAAVHGGVRGGDREDVFEATSDLCPPPCDLSPGKEEL